MVIKIIAVGKLKERYFTDAFAEYEKRLSAFCRLTVDEVEQVKLSDDPTDGETERALDKEAEAIIRRLPGSCVVIPMCVEGVQMTSEKFAGYLSRKASEGANTFVFIIGGSVGLSERVKKLSDLKLSMSEMTFPHRLARVMLAEQLYRAFTIINNRKYHK